MAVSGRIPQWVPLARAQAAEANAEEGWAEARRFLARAQAAEAERDSYRAALEEIAFGGNGAGRTESAVRYSRGVLAMSKDRESTLDTAGIVPTCPVPPVWRVQHAYDFIPPCGLTAHDVEAPTEEEAKAIVMREKHGRGWIAGAFRIIRGTA